MFQRTLYALMLAGSLFGAGCIFDTDDDGGAVDADADCVTQCDETEGSCSVDCDDADNECTVACSGDREECVSTCG